MANNVGSPDSLLRKWSVAALRKGSIERAALGSLFGASLIQIALVVSGVILARDLGPENRGYFAFLNLWPYILFQLGELGLPSAVAYYVALHPSDTKGIAMFLVPTFIVQTVLLCIVMAVVVGVYAVSRPASVLNAGMIALVVIPANIAMDYSLAILQGWKRFGLFNTFRALPTVVTAIGVSATYLVAYDNLVAVMATWCATSALCAVVIVAITFRAMRNNTGERASIVRPRELLSFGSRSLMGTLSPIESFRVDQVIVGIALGPVSLGYYVVGLAFTNLPRFIATGLAVVAYPNLASQAASAKATSFWRFVGLTLALTALCVALLELMIDPLIAHLFGSAFVPAVSVGRILILGGFLFGMKRILTEGLKGAGFAGAGTIAEVASWGVVIPAFVVAWALHLSILGIATVVVCSGVTNVVVLMLLGRQFFRRIDKWGAILKAPDVNDGVDVAGTSHVELQP